MESSRFRTIFEMGADGKKRGKDTQISNQRDFFFLFYAQNLVIVISLLCDLLLQIARQRPYNKNRGKHDIKSKLSKGLKNPTPHIDDILQILCLFLGAVTPKPSLNLEAVLSC